MAETAPQDSQEPSIEEILASIRKIISEDDPPAEGTGAAAEMPAVGDMRAPAMTMPAPQQSMENEDDVLELTDYLEEDPVMDVEPEPAFVEAKPIEVKPPEPASTPTWALEPEAVKPVQKQEEALVSFVSENAATDAMARLARLSQMPPKPADRAPFTTVSSRSLDDMVEDMLRPMLSEWLDGNLPRLVEKLVERELHRMSRRAEER